MFVILCTSLTIGAVLYSVLHLGLGGSIFFGTLCVVSCAVMFRTIRGALFGMIVGATLVLGSLAVWIHEAPIPPELFGTRAFEATVLSVDRRLESTNLVILDDSFERRLQITTKEQARVLPGDRVSVRVLIQEPQDFTTTTGRVFGYRQYLASKGIVGVGRNAVVALINKGNMSLSRVATQIRFAIADVFGRYVAFPIDGVLAGMVVGYQGGIPQYIQDLFRTTGVLHVLVLSGYNITLLAGFLALLLRGVSFRIRTAVTIGAIALLVLVSGAGIASVRAGIMGSIAFSAGLLVRTYQPIRALCIAYVLFFFLSPGTLFADPGFHLSFLATLFMIAVVPRIEQFFAFIPQTNHIDIRELTILAIGVPIFMLPYTMYFSGLFPVASPLANVVLAIVTPLVMVLGVVLVVVSWIPLLATVVGVCVSFLGNAVIWILLHLNNLPQWNTPPLSGWGISLFYTLILVVIFRGEIMLWLVHARNSFQRRTNLRS